VTDTVPVVEDVPMIVGVAGKTPARSDNWMLNWLLALKLPVVVIVTATASPGHTVADEKPVVIVCARP